jgi:hypothetical protein
VLASSAGSSVYGQPVTFTTTVAASAPGAGTPTGTVTFSDGSTVLGIGILNGAGAATFTTGSLTAGGHTIRASYGGDANFVTSASAALTQSVLKAATATVVASSASPSVVGQPMTSTAAASAVLAVSPAGTAAVLSSPLASTAYGEPVTFSLSLSNTSIGPVPTGGTVTFYLDYGTSAAKSLGSAALSKGVAMLTSKAILAGSHTITAVFAGTANFLGSTSNVVSQAVSAANTAVTLGSTPASGSTVTYGSPVTLAASVTDGGTGLVPTGMVEFLDETTMLGIVSLNGQGTATFTTRSLARGSHGITAVYLGTANFNGSNSGAVSLTVV